MRKFFSKLSSNTKKTTWGSASRALGFAPLLLGLSPCFAQTSPISDSTKSRLLRETEYIGSIYREYYAPKTWKEVHLKWDLETELSKLQDRVRGASNRWDYRDGLVDFLTSMADYHVGFAFFSTEKSTLPFGVRTIEGKTLIVHIDRKAASMESFPFSEGDELVEMDHLPIAQVLSQIKKDLGNNVPATDAAIADLRLTGRTGRKNAYSIPKGPVLLKIRRQSSGELGTVQLNWNYEPETIVDRNLRGSKSPRAQNSSTTHTLFSGTGNGGAAAVRLGLLNLKMYSPLALSFADISAGSPSVNLHSIGAKKSFVPDFGPRIWEAAPDNTFDAYIFVNELGRLIGVIRIPGYIVPDYNKASSDFRDIMKKFQAQTSGLIIDQVNNGGGSIYYLYNLISMLTDQALSTPKHRVTLTHAMIMEAHTTLQRLNQVTDDASAKKLLDPDMNGYTATYQVALFLRDYARFLISQWNEGKSLSEPINLGVDFINPHPEARYTKPIVVTVNELDFSGGDFFPAILQDNARARIVGVRTSGAGGYVNEVKIENQFGFELITFTGSIAERANKQPIENLGITPDQIIPMTVHDYQNGFSNYKKSVMQVLNGMIK